MGSAALLGACAGTQGGPAATAALPGPAGRKPEERPPGPDQTVKAALLLPLGSSIQLSIVGKALQQAAELALFERNAPELQLLVRDDKGTPEGAAAAATTAIADGAEIILGPLLGTSVAAVAPIARQAQVPVIAFSNDPANAGRGVHLLSFFASAEATRVASYAVGQGRRHIAALISADVLGRDTETAFRHAVEAGGGLVAVVERYPAELSGMIEPAQRLMEAIRSSADSEAPIDALYLPSSGENIATLITTLRHHELDIEKIKLIVSSGWDTPTALREPRLAGAWLAGPDPGGWREFSARFAKTYNAMPPRVASLAYDAVMVATAFASRPRGQRYTPSNLMREQGFTGSEGAIRFTPSGLIERSLAVLELQPRGLVRIDPARGFTPATGAPYPSPVGAVPVARG